MPLRMLKAPTTMVLNQAVYVTLGEVQYHVGITAAGCLLPVPIQMQRKTILLIEGVDRLENAKTAINLIRYRPEDIVAVLDRSRCGQTSQSLFGVGGDIPVIGDLREVDANTLIIGIAPPGGKIPPVIRSLILQALSRRMTVISGMHEFLSNDAEMTAVADRHGARLVDLRNNQEREVAQAKGFREQCLRIQTIGQDCNVGKMLVSLELSRALKKMGHDAKFVATGQTGMLIEGDGCPVDAVVADFLNGAAERLVLAHQHHDILLIEGQGALVHPRYSAVTLGLLHGCRPQGLILCYETGRPGLSGMEFIPVTPLSQLISLYESLAEAMQPSKVIGIAMNSRRDQKDEARREQDKIRTELALPVCDIIRDGPGELVRAILDLKSTSEK